MAYSGSNLKVCLPLDMTKSYAVIVSGDGINFCGHALLNVGGKGGYYFHVAGIHDYPKYMRQEEYDKYLIDTKKEEIGRYYKRLAKPQSAYDELVRVMQKKWLWGVLPNNCIAFVEQILQSGGSSFGIFSNCPIMHTNKEEVRATTESLRRQLSEEALIQYFTGGRVPGLY
ncbi:hypothetical protein [Motiliproteus sp. MSK22-1]|uniref:hypothetical protein n=1 Tax=Motiliproteus sp. MSK22-1 TaxID=1897630 RepID=UPI000976BF02|nr:hypothetical protein [Motiliproteus sp. MSK22-1]OMH33828.1 hypothetical protein BGP75_12635 [Motiliproteus sp. MSK22-1]